MGADLPSLISEGRRLIAEATKGPYFYNSYNAIFSTPLVLADEEDAVVARVPADHGDTANKPHDAALLVFATSHLPALLDVAEAGERLLAYHDNCGVESTHGDALRAALAKLKEVK